MDCDFTVRREHSIRISGGALMLASGRTLVNLGNIANGATFRSAGRIVNCAGSYSGNAGEFLDGGVYTTDHSWTDGVCSVCGAKQEVTEITRVEIHYMGSAIAKTYDKTRNVTLKASDFNISGVAAGHEVYISALSAAYDSAQAGKRTVNVSFTLGGRDAALYSCDSLSISATIRPRTLTITPTPNQTKTYGAADPSYYTGKVKGLLSGDQITGRLSREKGENAGQYKILQGTISAGDNYSIEVLEAYFTIEPKSIDSTDVALMSIGNQRYTGGQVMPEVSLSYGNSSLVEGIDYTVSYSGNVSPGTATVRVRGIGNFGGERSTTFRILNVSSGVDYTGGETSGNPIPGSGGGISQGFYADPEGDGAFAMSDAMEDVGHLMLNGVDEGAILFNDRDEPCAFMQVEETVGDDQSTWRLRILPDPQYDEYTGETLYLTDSREKYGNLHLHLSVDLVQRLMDAGFVEICVEVENAAVVVDLDDLGGEILADTADGSQAVSVDAYDIALQQVEALSEREAMGLNGRRQLSYPYGLSVSAEASQSDDQGNEIVYNYPALGQLSDLTLRIAPIDGVEAASAGCEMTWVSSDEDADAEAAVRHDAAEFAGEEEVYAVTLPDADGMYVLTAPSEGD